MSAIPLAENAPRRERRNWFKIALKVIGLVTAIVILRTAFVALERERAAAPPTQVARTNIETPSAPSTANEATVEQLRAQVATLQARNPATLGKNLAELGNDLREFEAGCTAFEASLERLNTHVLLRKAGQPAASSGTDAEKKAGTTTTAPTANKPLYCAGWFFENGVWRKHNIRPCAHPEGWEREWEHDDGQSRWCHLPVRKAKSPGPNGEMFVYERLDPEERKKKWYYLEVLSNPLSGTR